MPVSKVENEKRGAHLPTPDKQRKCAFMAADGSTRCARNAVRDRDYCAWHDPDPERQCRAFSQATGKPCERNARPGYVTCELHGVGTPLHKNAAKRRLLLLLEPAFSALERAMEYGDWPVVVRAATVILDRAGFGPTATLNVENTGTKDLSELTEAELEQRAKLVFNALQQAQSINRQAEQQLDKFLPPAEVTEVPPEDITEVRQGEPEHSE